MQTSTVFGYAWSDIQAAQQGASLSKPLPKTRSASVQCSGCHKFFKLSESYFANTEASFPILCPHCSHSHDTQTAKANFWPNSNRL